VLIVEAKGKLDMLFISGDPTEEIEWRDLSKKIRRVGFIGKCKGEDGNIYRVGYETTPAMKKKKRLKK
jgi:hypothetical protein